MAFHPLAARRCSIGRRLRACYATGRRRQSGLRASSAMTERTIGRLDCARLQLELRMGQFSIGQSVRRREDPRLLTGPRALLRRPQARRPAPRRDRALAARPCRHPQHRHARGAADARRACRADRQGLRRRRARHACRRWRPTRSATAAPMYLPHRPAIAVGRVHACRLSGRGGGRRHARSRPRRRRARRGRLRAAARRGVGARRRSSRARRSSTTIARTTRPISTRPATRPRPTRPSPAPPMWSSSASSSTASPPTRSSRAASPANTTPAPAATRCIAASSGRGCSATPSPRPR